MAKCPTCGSPVASDADVCPDCGMDLQGALFSTALFGAPASVSVAAVVPAAQASPAPVPLADIAMPVALTEEPSAEAPTTSPPAGDAPANGATLVLKRGGILTGEKFQLGPTVTIGRFDPDSGPVDIDMAPLPESVYISRHHAQIRCDTTGKWFVKDLGSRNGTFVRSPGQTDFQRVTEESSVADRDEISLGNARFEFHLGA